MSYALCSSLKLPGIRAPQPRIAHDHATNSRDCGAAVARSLCMRKVLGSIPNCSIVLRFSVLSFVVEFARDVGVGGGTKWDGLPCGCWLGQLRNPADNSYGSFLGIRGTKLHGSALTSNRLTYWHCNGREPGGGPEWYGCLGERPGGSLLRRDGNVPGGCGFHVFAKGLKTLTK